MWKSSYITPQYFGSLNKDFEGILKQFCDGDKKIMKSIELDVYYC